MPFTRENSKAMGSKGGKATLAKYGREHYQQLGRRGFAGLVRRVGCYRARKAAVEMLQGKGRLDRFPIERLVAELAKIPADPDTAADEPDSLAGLNRLVDHVLASIRSAPLPADGGL